MKPSLLSGLSGSSDTEMNEEIQEAVIDTIRNSDDKVVEIRPADGSKGGSKFPLLALVGGVLAVSYWLRKTRRPAETIENAMSEAADRTREATEQTAGTIEEGGETMAERVEEGSHQASDKVEQFGEEAADMTEEAGEEAADKAEQADDSGPGSTGRHSSN